MTATDRRATPLARQSGGRHANPRRVQRPPLTFPKYVGKHRAPEPPQFRIDLVSLLGCYEDTYARHRRDGRSAEDAMALALIDADDALTAWAVSL